MLNDLRHGWRMLLKAKGWTAVVLISLALGIGASTALFTAVNGLLLRMLPVADPDTLVRLRYAGPNDMFTNSGDYGYSGLPGSARARTTFSYPMYREFVAANQTLTDLFACAPLDRVNVVVDGQAGLASAFVSSGNYYQVLGITARVGRTIVPDDDRADAPPVAVISSRYWHERFGTDPSVVGRPIRINTVPATIIGVLPPAFTGIQHAAGEPPDIAVPLALDARINPGERRLDRPTYWWLQVMGRLRPGASPAQVQGNLAGVFQQAARAGLDGYLASLPEARRSTARNRGRSAVPRLHVDSGAYGIYDADRRDLATVTMLAGVVGLVLLIVCANVANLMLSRGAARRREIAIRLSLGAGRGRLVRQLLTESLLLAALGGVLGMLVAHWARGLLPDALGRAASFDPRVLAFAATVTLLTGLMFGIVPAMRATAAHASAAMKESSHAVAGSRSRLGKSLLVAQVAVSLVLLAGAGLLLRTQFNLTRVNVGFNADDLVLFRINPALNRYDGDRMHRLYGELLERLPAVPGVSAVAMSQPGLLTGGVNSTSIFVEGRQYASDREDGINRLVVSPNFFEVMDIPLLAGRGLTLDDRGNAPLVALINAAAARKYFPGENPVGRRFGNSVETSGRMEIVGIVGDAKYESLRDEPAPTIYVPYLQTQSNRAVFEVRTSVAPPAVLPGLREAVRKIDPDLPLMDVSTQLEEIHERAAQERLLARACALFGALALVLTSVGLFGLMSYSVARRTDEIGIRMALGAGRGDVLRLVMRESMGLVLAGVAIGLVLLVPAGEALRALLFGLTPTDLTTIVAAIALMLGVSALAGFLPARRAARVEPIVALRHEY